MHNRGIAGAGEQRSTIRAEQEFRHAAVLALERGDQFVGQLSAAAVGQADTLAAVRCRLGGSDHTALPATARATLTRWYLK